MYKLWNTVAKIDAHGHYYVSSYYPPMHGFDRKIMHTLELMVG